MEQVFNLFWNGISTIRNIVNLCNFEKNFTFTYVGIIILAFVQKITVNMLNSLENIHKTLPRTKHQNLHQVYTYLFNMLLLSETSPSLVHIFFQIILKNVNVHYFALLNFIKLADLREKQMSKYKCLSQFILKARKNV